MSYYFIAYNKPAYKLKQTPQNTYDFLITFIDLLFDRV